MWLLLLCQIIQVKQTLLDDNPAMALLPFNPESYLENSERVGGRQNSGAGVETTSPGTI